MGRNRLLLILLTCLLVMAAGCSRAPDPAPAPSKPDQPAPAPAPAKPPEPYTLIVIDPAYMKTFDPHIAYDGPSAQTTRNAYETLVRYSGTETDQIEPCLAESWDRSPDGMAWTFKLRQGVKFHDGTVMDADAVKFSFERLMAVNKGPAWMFTGILSPDTITVIDPHTIRFELTSPFAPFLEILASQWGPLIVSPTAVRDNEQDGDWAQEWLRENSCGTGAYTVEALTADQVTLRKFPDYWRGWTGEEADRVVIKTVREPATRRMLLETGDADIVNALSPDDMADLKDDPNIFLSTPPSLRNLNLYFVMNGPMKDVRVRQAVNYAFDFEAMINDVMRGFATKAHGPIPKRLWGHNSTMEFYSYDLDRAKALLAEAGYSTGLELEAWFLSGREDMRQACELLQNGLAKIGVTLNVREVTGGAMWDMIDLTVPDNKPHIYTLYWYPDYADPMNFLYPCYHTSSIGDGSYNGGLYSNAEVDRLLDEAMVSMDRDEAISIYRQVQEIMVKDAAGLWVMDMPEAVGLRKNVTGYVFNPVYTNTYDFWSIHKE